MILQGLHYETRQPVSIHLEAGKIRAIAPLQNPPANLPLIAPGLVEIHINGYLGLDFNTLPIPHDTPAKFVRALWAQGVTTSYPTIITNSPESILAGMTTIAAACDSDPVTAAGIAGIHLEGPFISPEDGARGAHPRQHVRAPDWNLFQQWQAASGNRIKLLTLSPEWPEAPDFIRRCADSGVTVSIGHTAATPDQIQQAVKAGARMSTHLGNAAHLMLPRHPNYIWEQLAQDDLYAAIIADGFHLPDQVIKVIMKVKGEKTIVTSDAVCQAGLPPGPYTTPIGGKIILTPAGKLHLAENEKILGGSAQMLLKGIQNLAAKSLATLAQAWNMSSTIPAKFMNLPVAPGLGEGAPADLMLFQQHTHQITPIAVYKSGRQVYP